MILVAISFCFMVLNGTEQVMTRAIQTMTVGGETFYKAMDCLGQDRRIRS